jgi:hypothetical protein
MSPWRTLLLRRQALLLIIGMTIVAGCQPAGEADMELTQTLTRAAEGVAPGQVLSLDAVVTQPWDQVLLVGPYTPNTLIEKATGGALPAALQRIDIDKRDDVNAVVFLLDGKASAAVALPRRVADFNKADLLRPVARAQAQLVRAASGVEFRWRTP